VNSDNFFICLLGLLVATFLLLGTVIKVNHVEKIARRTERVVAVACGVYGEKDPQLALLCAKNGF
jgi:hypothetical protein